MAAWREGLEDPFIQEIVQFARDHHLDLSVSREAMNPWDIQVEERVDPAYVKTIVQVLRVHEEWPEDMPLVVVMGGATTTIMDGSHRTTAARVAELESIPVLVANADTYLLINGKYDIPMFDYVHSILPAVDALMAENERKDEQGGRSKKRIVDSWDMDAFGEEPMMGTVRRGPRGKKGAPAGFLYHSTFANLAPQIAKKGLQPSESPRWGGQLGDWSVGKVFFSGHISAVAFYAAHHFAKSLFEEGHSPDPILLRIDSKHLQDAERDTASWDDWFVERSVPPGQIEVWTPWLEAWMPIKSIASEMSDMETVKGRPDRLDVDAGAGADVYTSAYFKKVWPQDDKS